MGESTVYFCDGCHWQCWAIIKASTNCECVSTTTKVYFVDLTSIICMQIDASKEAPTEVIRYNVSVIDFDSVKLPKHKKKKFNRPPSLQIFFLGYEIVWVICPEGIRAACYIHYKWSIWCAALSSKVCISLPVLFIYKLQFAGKKRYS